MKGTPNLVKVFKNVKVVGLASHANTGKSNNLVHMIKEFKEYNTTTPFYIYGFNPIVTEYLKVLGCKKLSGRRALSSLSDCIVILDEFQELSLNDRRYRESTDKLFNFMYHKNVAILLSSPDARAFNSIIGSKVQRWVLKTIDPTDCINGSQLKQVVLEYANVDNSVMYPKHQAVVTGYPEEVLLNFEYVEDVDTKKNNKDLFALTQNCQKKIVKSNSVKKVRKKLSRNVSSNKVKVVTK